LRYRAFQRMGMADDLGDYVESLEPVQTHLLDSITPSLFTPGGMMDWKVLVVSL
jgi:hypothetical protein